MIKLLRPTSLAALFLATSSYADEAAPLKVALLGGDQPSDTPTAPKGADWNAWAWLRARGSAVSAFALDRTGTPNDLEKSLQTRVRVGGVYAPAENFSITAELDALSGQAAGATNELGTLHSTTGYAQREGALLDPTSIDLRQAFVTWRTPIAEIRAGRMSFRWGLGMVANDGRGEPDFGDKRRGDIIDRVLFITKPFSRMSSDSWAQTTFFVGGDSIARDENADARRGDVALQGIAGFRWEGERASLGGLFAMRGQSDRVEPGEASRSATVHAVMSDVTGKLVAWSGEQGEKLSLEGEYAMVRGDTTRPLFEATAANGAAIHTQGFIARATYELPSSDLLVRGELGHASGDADPYDATVRSFSFDPDYRVGLLLFDPIVRRVLARSIERASDPELVRVPQAGLRFLDTQGAVTNATYGNLVARWRPLSGLDVRAGLVVARTAAGLVDPYESAARGGYATDPSGRSAEPSALGKELDGAVRYTLPIDGVGARLLVDGAVLFPSRSLDVLAASTVRMARVGIDLWW